MSLRNKWLWIFRVTFVLIVALGIFFAGRKSVKRGDSAQVTTRIDTLLVRDTITQDKPVYITKTQVRTEYVPVCDTIRIHDTLYVPVPIERKVYEDSLYRAEVSGYKASLDRIDIYQQERIVKQIETIFVKERKRWGIGVQAGYGAGVKDGNVFLTPYVGIGVSYNLIRW